MKKLASLLWKEWHETRVFLWIGLGAFLGLPCIGGLESLLQYSHRFEILASPWVMLFGGVFALFVAVGTTCRDLSPHLEDFWRSRPVSVVRWFLVKYAVGLAIALFVCVLPLLVERWLNPDTTAPWSIILWMPFLWAALYTVAFASGCLIRRPTHAAMLALAAMLLIYFLPLVLPALRAMNLADVVDAPYGFQGERLIWSPNGLIFATGMAAITIIILAIALAAVRFQWRIEAGQRLMYGAVSAALLIVFAMTGYQLGTNLPILQQAGIPADEIVRFISCEGNRGFVITINGYRDIKRRAQFRSLELTSAGIQLAEPQEVDLDVWDLWFSQFKSPPGHPEIIYEVSNGRHGSAADYQLLVGRVDRTPTFDNSEGLPLWHADSLNGAPLRMCVWGHQLCVIGRYVATFDISDPMSPRLISQLPFSFLNLITWNDENAFAMKLPSAPDLPKEGRLQAAVAAAGWDLSRSSCFDGEFLCGQYPYAEAENGRIMAWRLTKLTDESAVFAKIGQYQETTLEQIFGSSFGFGSEMTMRDGLLYLNPSYARNGNPRVTVFDLRSPHPLRPAGHFAAPGIQTVCPLPDGRALIGGSQLWLVGPPPSRR